MLLVLKVEDGCKVLEVEGWVKGVQGGRKCEKVLEVERNGR